MVDPAEGVLDGSVTLTATLSAGSGPIAGAAISFTLNGNPVGSAITNSSGVASLTVSLAGISVGTYSSGVGASFAGGQNNPATSSTAQLKVDPAAGGAIGGNLSLPTATPTPGPVGSQVVISPQRLSFGQGPVGGASAPLSATLTNHNRFPIQVFSVAINGPTFAETDNCVGTLAAYGSCSIGVVFSPTVDGVQTATLKINDSTNRTPQGAVQYPHTVALTGVGISTTQKVTAAPRAISFGAQAAGTRSASRTVTLVNNQSAALQVGMINASNNFVITANKCKSSLAPKTSCTIDIGFAPRSFGNLTGSLTISTDATTSPLSVALSGDAPAPFTPTPTGTPRSRPTPTPTASPSPVSGASILKVTPRRLSFGSEAMGSSASEARIRYVILFNPKNGRQNTPIMIDRVTTTGDFGIPANACVGALAPGQRCKVPVHFIPRGAGIRKGSLSVESGARNGLQTVSLSGQGLAQKQ